MLEETRRRIEGHWARRFGVPVPGLAPVVIGSTGLLRDAAVVLLLGDHAYVDAPAAHLDDIVAVARDASPAEVLDPQRWAPVAAGPVAGPVDHWWADRGTELAGDVDALEDSRRRSLAATFSEDVWREAGFDRPLQASFGVVEDDTVLAASVVTALWGWPLDVGVLVRPDARGRGLGRRVAQAALAAAVGLSGFAAFRVDRGNPAAQRIAAGLGLTRYGTHVSVPLPVG